MDKMLNLFLQHNYCYYFVPTIVGTKIYKVLLYKKLACQVSILSLLYFALFDLFVIFEVYLIGT